MTATVRHRLDVGGVVQGVGFRPFVHGLATGLGLVGFVRNEATHVRIEVEGPATRVDDFEHRLRRESPPLARVDTIEVGELPCAIEDRFHIAASDDRRHDRITGLIPPDTAVCADCLAELFDPADRRHRHPFITCTNCGPRFTIIDSLPYDRSATTMAGFPLCKACATEYADSTDRRHHAQPLGCNDCGPVISYRRDDTVTTGTDETLAAVLADLDRGDIVAIKGLGGYHLAVDAGNEQAVRRLRDRKARIDEPFAVMVTDLDTARRLAHVDDAEAAALMSPARPIVLLRARGGSAVAPSVTTGSPLIGVMLPYTGVHHLLFRPVPGHRLPVPTVLVVTSANRSGEPICFDDADARVRLPGLADSVCTHDRPIRVPCDDSVIRLIDGIALPIRRSRGVAPLPVGLPASVPPILAVGGEIKNTFALATGTIAWMSQHLGEMGTLETERAVDASVDHLTGLYGVEPELLAVDAHPGYRSRQWGHDHADGRPVVEVHHHHAHLASLMAEHGLDGSEPVAGFVFDGTGHGADGSLWGGEVLVGDYTDVERWGHLGAVRLPGGDSAAHNPCRTALAHLKAAEVEWADDLPPAAACDPTERRVLERQLTSDTACVTSSSMGRLFDAVASLLDLHHRITYEAQAAIALEALAAEATGLGAPLRFAVGDDGTIDAAPVITGLVDGIRSGVDRAALARGFHEAVTEAMVTCAETIRRARGIEMIGLTGGVFQNAVLTHLTVDRLADRGFEVLTHRIVPPNDGGLALGQVMVAAARHPNGSR